MSSPRSDNPAGSVAASSALDLRVSSELLRIAFHDSLYGVPFATAAAILFAIAAMGSFPSAVVLGWLIATVAWNIARLIVRDRYMRQPVPVEHTRRWAYLFTILAAGSGLCWGTAAWLFYTAHESIFRVMIVLVLAGLTTGASRLLAPIIQANLAYSFFSVGPLITRVLMTSETPSSILVLLCVLYLAYVGIAARQQITTLRRAIRLRHENTALVESLGAAKERAELLNRELTAEMTRRSTVEDDMRAATAQAQAANRAKSDFLATMSHEIRTPMNGIIGMLRILHDTPLSPEQRESIEVAAASADTLLDLLNNILDFSKIEAGRLDLERIPFSPQTAAKGVIDLLRPRAIAKALSLDLDLDPRIPANLIGDPTRLRQILINLVGNAIKFTDHGGVSVVVKLASAAEGQTALRFMVIDTGIGIPPEAMQRLFTPFTQADSSMSRRFGGSGLGLAICRKLAEAMGGNIGVRAHPEGGTIFEFTARFAQPAPSTPTAAATGAAPTFVAPQLRGRVLVVEDDRVNQRVIGHFLKQMRLETGLAEDGLAAVRLGSEQPWDLILMDLQLPGVDGIEATRRIRAHRTGQPLLPIIAITANASIQDREACLAAGMDDFITKPIRPEILAAALQRWLPGRDAN